MATETCTYVIRFLLKSERKLLCLCLYFCKILFEKLINPMDKWVGGTYLRESLQNW